MKTINLNKIETLSPITTIVVILVLYIMQFINWVNSYEVINLETLICLSAIVFLYVAFKTFKIFIYKKIERKSHIRGWFVHNEIRSGKYGTYISIWESKGKDGCIEIRKNYLSNEIFINSLSIIWSSLILFDIYVGVFDLKIHFFTTFWDNIICAILVITHFIDRVSEDPTLKSFPRILSPVIISLMSLILLANPIFLGYEINISKGRLSEILENYKKDHSSFSEKLDLKLAWDNLLFEKKISILSTDADELIDEIGSFIERYPKVYHTVYSTNELREVKNGEYVKITSQPAKIHLESLGKINFNFSSEGYSDNFITGGIFSRMISLDIVSVGSGKGLSSNIDAIDGTYWSTFIDGNGNVFIVKEAVPGQLFLNDRFRRLIGKFDKRSIEIGNENSDQVMRRSLLYYPVKHYYLSRHNFYSDKEHAFVINKENLPNSDLDFGSFNKKNNKLSDDISSKINREKGRIKNKIQYSFRLNTEEALNFKLQSEADASADKGIIYELIGVKTEIDGMPIVNVVSYKRHDSHSRVKEIYTVNKK